MFTFLRSEKNQVISSKTLVWSPMRLAAKVCIFTLRSWRLDWIVQIKFGLRPDIRSDLVDQTEFWTDLECKTERLSSLETFVQIRTQTEVWSKN